MSIITRQDQALAQTLDLRQAAAYSGLGYWCLYDLAHAGLIATVRIPDTRKPGRNQRRILFRREALDSFLQQHESSQPMESNTSKRKRNLKGKNS